MAYTTIISAGVLLHNINNPDWVVVDCRFSLAHTNAGIVAWRHGHIPNARYADINKDLCSPIKDYTGRHPLPDFNLLVKKLAAWGISTSTQVVAYDDAGGAFAGRLWWLLRCLGHEQCAVLNGGIKHWQSLGLPVTTALPQINPGRYRPYMNSSLWLNARELENAIARKNICLMDARTPERYQGTQEPVDPIAGHIPYAINRPFQLNLDKNGLFLPADLLSSQFRKLTGTTPPEQVIHYCGSGITACHNLLAMEYANLKNSKLYAGSWSEWIKNKNRAVVTAK